MRIGRFGFCPSCNKLSFSIKTVHQGTMYVEDILNYFTGCKTCREINADHWSALMDDYYGSR